MITQGVMLCIFMMIILVIAFVSSYYCGKKKFDESEDIRMAIKDFMLKAKDSKSMLELCDVQKELNKYCSQYNLRYVNHWKIQVGYYIDGKVDGINLMEK